MDLRYHWNQAANRGALASIYMEDWCLLRIAPWRAQDLAREAARHAFLARPDLKREA